MSRLKKIARRTFLIGSAAIAGGVAFGAYVVARPTPNPLLDELQDGDAAITPFIKITQDSITFIVPRADVGQGIASIQGYLIAEELDIDPTTVTLDPGQPHEAYFNGEVAAAGLPFPLYDEGTLPETLRDIMITVARLSGAQFTGGSSSLADLHKTLRHAGASARETLKAAAAKKSGVPVDALTTENGAVILPDGTRLAYMELAATAATTEPVTEVELRPAADLKWLGKPMQRLDTVA